MDKILNLQMEIGTLSKTETNPFYKSKYFDINSLLAQLMPLLEKYNLTVLQPLSNVGGKPALRTIVRDSSSNNQGGDLTNVLCDDVIPLPDIADPQKMGSAITYYRRYALQSLFLLQAEDDDGNSTVKKEKTLTDTLKDKDLPF